MSDQQDMEVEMEEEENNEEVDSDLEEDDDDEEEESSDDEAGEEKTFLPGDKVEDGEELQVDENAYILYHQASLGPPCLSFDIIHDQCKYDFPVSVTGVSGRVATKNLRRFWREGC